jgi:hypothetical protein
LCIFVFKNLFVRLLRICVDCFLQLFTSYVVVFSVAGFVYAGYGLFGIVTQVFQLFEWWEVMVQAMEFGKGFIESGVPPI